MDSAKHLDIDLLARAIAGDAQAFEQLITPLQQPMYGYALGLCGDPHLAEDLCQEAFIKGYRGISEFAGNAALGTWLYRILHNTWLDQLKKRRRQALDMATPNLDVDGVSPLFSDEAVARYQAQVRGADARDSLGEALASLSPTLRSVLVLREVNGLSYGEIASVTGLAVGTVKSRISRGRRTLRQFLVSRTSNESR
jgi:RNA polymerase sigma-70 factor (ECF subfamily)